MKPGKHKLVELRGDQLAELLQHAAGALNEADYQLFKALVESYAYLTNLVEDKGTTIQRLRRLLFGASSEKTGAVFQPSSPKAAPPATGEQGVIVMRLIDAIYASSQANAEVAV